ncbi:MAG TPA: DUF3093 domain-containing protein [Propioniciclava tarda]|nr:DUF3093 domain-containing protein [Propioniciclava tarda]HQA30838.1 DUF3093 domain-containing protein [Propioniciclava tarda]
METASVGRQGDAVPVSSYTERLYAPWSYWVIAFGVGLSFVTAIGWYLGPWYAVGSAILTACGIATVLLWVGSVRIRVDSRGLWVGRSLLEWEYLGPVTALDAESSRLRLGRDADLRAFVVTRPFLLKAVEVGVRDAADPHPYWLVGTRSPAGLARALTSPNRPGPAS